MDDTLEGRFVQLVGMVRHEFWLHDQRPVDYEFRADSRAFTLRARNQWDGSECVQTVTKTQLLGDLHALARHFYKELCGGRGALVRP